MIRFFSKTEVPPRSATSTNVLLLDDNDEDGPEREQSQRQQNNMELLSPRGYETC